MNPEIWSANPPPSISIWLSTAVIAALPIPAIPPINPAVRFTDSEISTLPSKLELTIAPCKIPTIPPMYAELSALIS